MLSVSMRVGQSATWHNRLCSLCQRCSGVLFLFSHILHTAEQSLQNSTQIRDEQPWRFRVVWQGRQKLIAWRPPPPPPTCPCFSLICAFFMFIFWRWMCNSGCGSWNLVGLFVCGCPFLCCHYCPWDLWVVCVFHRLLTLCGSNWWSMSRDEVVIQLGVVGGHLSGLG